GKLIGKVQPILQPLGLGYGQRVKAKLGLTMSTHGKCLSDWVLLVESGGRPRPTVHRHARQKLGISSIVGGQQQCGYRSIRFRDDPELFYIRDLIAAHQAKSGFEAQFVFSLVVLTEIAPITTKMAREKFQR